MKDICKRLEIDTKMYKERSFLAAISSAKDELISPEAYAATGAGRFPEAEGSSCLPGISEGVTEE